MEEALSNIIDTLIGDRPVSEQLDMVLNMVANKDHEHANYATRNEVEILKQKIDMLIELVGDMPVSDQISAAFSNIK